MAKRRHHKRHGHAKRGGSLFSVRGIGNKVMPAVIGAGAALASDLLLQKTPLGSFIPAMFTTGYLKYVPRAAAVFAAAFAIGKVKPAWRNEALAGGLAVVMYSALKDLANGALGLQLASYDEYSVLGYMSPGTQVVDAYMGGGAPMLSSYMQNYPNEPAPEMSPLGGYMEDDDFNTADLS